MQLEKEVNRITVRIYWDREKVEVMGNWEYRLEDRPRNETGSVPDSSNEKCTRFSRRMTLPDGDKVNIESNL